jgi:hypothetical protein
VTSIAVNSGTKKWQSRTSAGQSEKKAVSINPPRNFLSCSFSFLALDDDSEKLGSKAQSM